MGAGVPGCVLRPLRRIVMAGDCARRCLCASAEDADRAPSRGVGGCWWWVGGFNSKWTCEDGSAKSVCVCARRGRGRSFAAAHKMVIVA